MKFALLSLLMLAFLQGLAATGSPARQGPPDIVVLKFSWNDYLDRPDWDHDLYLNPIQAGDAAINAKEQHRAPENRTLPPILPPQQLKPKHASRTIKGFQYKAAFRNTGRKVIRSVEWDYVFIDPVDGSEVARHTFESRTTIKPGRSREFIHFSVSPPTKVVSAGALGAGEASRPFTERVVIKSVVYSDRSSWQRP